MSTPTQLPPPQKPLLALQTTEDNGGNNNIVQLSPPAINHHLIIKRPSLSSMFKKPPPPPPSAAVKYMECLKNHAAAIGGSATDGCGEFMAGGEEGTLEALKCCACNCHRNFHRKIHIQPSSSSSINEVMKKSSHDGVLALKTAGEGEGGVGKKRFRTKFSQEQKEKMRVFAERAGWKIQKLEDSEVRRFCQEIGIKRKVLKVWMHNNKYHLAPKNSSPPHHHT